MQKQLLGAALTVAAGLVLAFGQPTLAKGVHQGGRLGKMAGTLGLTDAQKAQMKPILESARTQAKAVKGDTALSPEDRKAKMQAIRRSSRMQMGAILTPDQKLKMREMRRNRKGPGVPAPAAAPAF